MAKYSKRQTVSEETKDEAMRVARATQRPGQSKEQTRLIAQGIQKGIDLYKKQQKAKARALDKKRKKELGSQMSPQEPDIQGPETVTYRQHWLPWVLLLLSWLGMAGYVYLSATK